VIEEALRRIDPGQRFEGYASRPRSCTDCASLLIGISEAADRRIFPALYVFPRQNSASSQPTDWPRLSNRLRPLNRYDSTPSNTALPTSHPILQVKHLVARFQSKLGQESWREQRGMGARGTINFHEVARPEILDPGGIQRPSWRSSYRATPEQSALDEEGTERRPARKNTRNSR
jgi:hypothetical protein